MKVLRLFFVLIPTLWWAGCGSVKVTTLHDRSVSFDQYKTFCWLQGCQFTIDGPAYLQDSAIIAIFKNAIERELERKGFVRDEDNADFLLAMHIVVEEKEGMVSSLYDAFQSEDAPMYFGSDFTAQPYVYLQGSMILDIADANTSRMVWRSEAIRYMDANPDIEKKAVKKGVRRALKKFPPKE